MLLDIDDLDDVDQALVGLTEYLDDLGVSRSQQRIVLRERQAVAMAIVDETYGEDAMDILETITRH